MIALFLLLWVAAAGTLLARRLDPGATRRSDALALGAALGFATFTGIGFVLGWTLGLSLTTVILAAAVTMGMGVGFGAPITEVRKQIWTRPSRTAVALAILAILATGRLADRTLIHDGGGIGTGDKNNFGDLPFHMGVAAGFAWGDNFPPEHPELARVSLTYPFFCDLLSGMLLVAGGSWRDAFFWPTFLLGLSLLVALTRFGEAVTGSRPLGRVGALLTVFAGGLGFLPLLQPGGFAAWQSGSADLTINDSGLRYGNFITTLFIPQRAILFGWPLLFMAIALLVESRRRDGSGKDADGSSADAWWRAGVIASFLPLVHSHSFVVMGVCAGVFALRAGLRPTLAFARGVLPLALPAVIFMMTRNSLATSKFFAFEPGFDGGAQAPLRFWLMNAGVFLPLVAAGLALRAGRRRAVVAVPFVALFVAANLFRLSPWMWDNIKFLAPAHAGLAPFAALALGALWEFRRALRPVAVLLFVAAVVSGALDASRVAGSGVFGIFSLQDIEFGSRVREATPASAVILTGGTHNHPVLLSGRRQFIGYEGHLWSQGLEYGRRKAAADAFFAGAPGPAPDVAVDALALTPAETAKLRDPRRLEGLPTIVDSPYRLVRLR